MSRATAPSKQLTSMKRFAVILALVWTITIFLGAAFSIRQAYVSTLDSARIQAAQFFEKDLTYRSWAASHGGVYVPITDATPPNPYLSNIENRDLTVSGLSLTLLNPAYMTRQVHELGLEKYGHIAHITSLNPIRPENAADPWETEALLSFEERETEQVAEVTTIEGLQYLRLMRPLVTEEGCLKCHAVQGYQVGDVRGGISVAVPMQEHWEVMYDQVTSTGIGYGFIWLLGLGGIGLGTSRLGRQVSERSRAEDRATSLGAILEQSMNEIYVFTPETYQFLEANWSARSNLGYSMEELRGLTPLDLKTEFTRELFEETIEPLRTGQQAVVEFAATHLRKDGSSYPVEVHLQLLSYMGEPAFVAIILDTTERVDAQEEKRKLAAQLQQKQKLESIGTLASGVAHEINNPLMGMLNYAELVKDRVQDLKAISYLGEIDNEGQRIARIVRNLLSFARQDAEQPGLADIREIIDGALTLVSSAVRKRQITVETDILEAVPMVMCRSQQIQQVLINLLMNSCDALHARYPDHDDNKIIHISVRSFETDGVERIKITVEDYGTGIAGQDAARIFDPFYTTKSRAEGTGLGLSVSFGIVRDHHGELTMESTPGEYTRFHINLPVDGKGESRE